MANLRGLTLEGEFNDIVAELGGDAAGRTRAAAFLASSHPLPDAERTRSWALTPKVFGSAELEILSSAAETMGSIIEKVTKRYLRDAEFRALFGLPEKIEELTLLPTGYDQLVPLARVDVVFDQQSGDFTVAGVATDGATGMTTSVDVTRAVQLTESYRRFAERHHDITTLDITDGVVATLRATYSSWANADAGTRHPDRPTVGIVDFPESARAGEFSDIIERLADEGVFARFVNIRDLRIEEAAGARRLVDSDGPIACVYRRAPLGEIAEKRCEGTDALIEAARRGIACVIGGFRSWPVATNAFLAVLSSDAMEDVLDPFELAFVRAHVPEAHVLTRDTDLAPYLAERERWLARPAGAYSAGEVVAGAACQDRDDWWRVLLACAEEGGIVLSYDAAHKSPVYLGGPAAGGEAPDEATLVDASCVYGLYLFHGAFGGIYARAGVEGIAGPWTSRVTMGSLVVSD